MINHDLWLRLEVQNLGGQNLFWNLSKGALHIILAINSLIEHATNTLRWLDNLRSKIEENKYSPDEKHLFLQQKIIHHLISSLVPKKSKSGFYDEPYKGEQSEFKLFKVLFKLFKLF